MNKLISNFVKGIAMGAANVIPGVSGGTIALITGIFEKLINSIKSFDIAALNFLLKGEFKKFAEHVNLLFLVTVFAGVGVSIISLAKLFDFLFVNYPIHIWSYFFGLILISVYFVGKRIDKWSVSVILSFVIGTLVALSITVLSPATENSNIFYLFLCGLIAACSMILPGLSGSFVLILMGNYQLVMIDAVNNFDFAILIPVVVGALIGLLAFSYILSWIFVKYKNQTIAVLTGFILGSLSVLWPWKEVVKTVIDRHGVTQPLKQINVLPWNFHNLTGNKAHIVFAIFLMIAGILSIWVLEHFAKKFE